MKTKRIIAMVLVLSMLSSFAYAEEDQSAIRDIVEWAEGAWNDAAKWTEQAWNDAASWADNAWNDATKWAKQAWNDAPEWIENAWGDASKWVEQAWNDSSKWVEDIWGDASTWTAETYNSTSEMVSAWWIDTFNTVTKETDNAWQWITEASQTTKDAIIDTYNDVSDAVSKGSAEAEKSLNDAYLGLLKQMLLDEKGISRIMETLKAYAEGKGILVPTLEYVLLPYLVELAQDAASNVKESISSLSVAQYLTGICEKAKIQTEEKAESLIKQIKDILNLE